MGGNLKEGGKEGLQEGAYSPYPREINIYFLQGGVLYIYSTERVAKEGDTANKKTRENERKQEQNGAFASYSELLRDWGNYPFPVRFKGLLNISVAAAGLRLLLCRFCVFPFPGWAIPVSCSGWGLIPSGRAEASPAGGQVSRGRDQRAGG